MPYFRIILPSCGDSLKILVYLFIIVILLANPLHEGLGILPTSDQDVAERSFANHFVYDVKFNGHTQQLH